MFSSQLTAVSAAFQAMEAENRALRARIAELEADPLPPATGGASTETIPTEADYRLRPADIRLDVCVGRTLKGNEDKRWSPAIYRETQCGGKIEEDGLCTRCLKKAAKGAAAAAADAAVTPSWSGRVTEEPFRWQHMLGTAWAVHAVQTGKLKWLGSDSASAIKAAEKEAAKAAAKAAKAAEKEAAKAAAKAAKAAEKEAAKEAAAAAKAAKAAAKAEAKAAIKAEANRELMLIGGRIYMIKGRELYEYDTTLDAAGTFVGFLDSATTA